jgi:hypothetical protein
MSVTSPHDVERLSAEDGWALVYAVRLLAAAPDDYDGYHWITE